MIQGMEGLSIVMLSFDPHIGCIDFWELSCKPLSIRFFPWVIEIMKLKTCLQGWSAMLLNNCSAPVIDIDINNIKA